MPCDPSARYRCFCGVCHVVTGTQFCLALYVALSAFSMIFGMKSTLTWLIVPLCVVTLGVYALLRHRHKYLYPFLVITVVQQLVCLMMAFMVTVFAVVSFETMRRIVGHSLDLPSPPSTQLTILVATGTVLACLVVALIHVWQAIIIYRCLEFYEECYGKDPPMPSSRMNETTFADLRLGASQESCDMSRDCRRPSERDFRRPSERDFRRPFERDFRRQSDLPHFV